MEAERSAYRYEMVNVRPGYIVVEHEVQSKAMRAYFSSDPVAPVEEYREGNRIWKHTATAQSLRFSIRDTRTGEVAPFDELLGLAFYGSCPKGTEVWEIGDLAQEHKVSIYVAVTGEAAEGVRGGLTVEKLRILNRYFNERLRDREKKILILPDRFGLYREFSNGHIMVDLGLTAME
ncbi:MAG: hypothetical protein LAO51_08160 [Acidobacteriia bacterium]|nr:hypothetical protein [Terriglobia bacterium]